jgi:hypothetical protein
VLEVRREKMKREASAATAVFCVGLMAGAVMAFDFLIGKADIFGHPMCGWWSGECGDWLLTSLAPGITFLTGSVGYIVSYLSLTKTRRQPK